MEFIIIISLILLNGVFAMSEIAVISSKKFKLESEGRRGNKGAKTALELSENPTRFLSTVQIGITLISILLGVFSGEKIAVYIVEFFDKFEFIRPYSKGLSVGLVVIIITYFSIVLGELFPKRIGMTFPEKIAIIMARPMKTLSVITSPFVWLLTSSNYLLSKIFGISGNSDSIVTEEEIKSIIKESAEGGEIQNIEQNIVERVFELGDRRINSLITHRTEIVFFNTTDNFNDIKEKVKKEKHSAYPLCENNNIDDVVGVVLLKDLFSADENFKISHYAVKPVFFNENAYAYEVLEFFKNEKVPYGIVIDEYGSTLGVVTLNDVVYALVGDSSRDYEIIKRDENSWLIDGQYPIQDFIKFFDLDIKHNNKFTTVAGLLIHESHTLPNVGEKFIFADYQVEVLDKDGQRIDKILISKI